MKKIFIVEDDPVTVRLLKVMLEKRNYDVQDCDNGAAAIDKIRDYKPDLVLMDVIMPEIDGVEATRMIKNDPELASIPVIILSALGQEIEVSKGLTAGADGYMKKPFDTNMLLKKIEELIK